MQPEELPELLRGPAACASWVMAVINSQRQGQGQLPWLKSPDLPGAVSLIRGGKQVPPRAHSASLWRELHLHGIVIKSVYAGSGSLLQGCLDGRQQRVGKKRAGEEGRTTQKSWGKRREGRREEWSDRVGRMEGRR